MSVVDEFSFSAASIGSGHGRLNTFSSFRLPSAHRWTLWSEGHLGYQSLHLCCVLLCLLFVVDSTLSIISSVNEGRAEHSYHDDFGREILPTYLRTGYRRSSVGLDFRVY